MSNTPTLEARVGADISGFERAMHRLAASAEDAASKSAAGFSVANKVFLSSVAGIGAVVGGIGFAAKGFVDFQSSMNAVEAVTQATRTEMKALTKQAEELGASTVFSAKEAAIAQEALGSAGFKVSQIIEGLPAVLDLAAAGTLDLGSAAQIAGAAINGFQLQAKDVSHVADVMAQVAADTATNVSQVGEAMAYVSGQAKASGLSLEETSAAIGALANVSITGSRAGTSFGAALDAILKPGRDLPPELERLRKSMQTSTGSVKPLVEIVRELGKANLTAGQTSVIFGEQGQRAMLALKTMGSAALEDFLKRLKEVDGSSKKMAETKLQGLPGAIEETKGVIEGLTHVIGKTFSPALEKLLKERIIPLVGGMAEWISRNDDLVISLTKSTGAILAFVAALSGIILARKFFLDFAVFYTQLSGMPLLLSKIGLVGAAAFTGWQIGTLLRSIYGFDEAVQGVIGTIMILGNKARIVVSQIALWFMELARKMGPVGKILGVALLTEINDKSIAKQKQLIANLKKNVLDYQSVIAGLAEDAQRRFNPLQKIEVPTKTPPPANAPTPPPLVITDEKAKREREKAEKIQQEMEESIASIHKRFLESRGTVDEAALFEIESRYAREEEAARKLFTNKAKLEESLAELKAVKMADIQALERAKQDKIAKDRDEEFDRVNARLAAEEANTAAFLQNQLEFYEETGQKRLANELRLEDERDKKLRETFERQAEAQGDTWEDFERERAMITATYSSKIRKIQENEFVQIDRQAEESKSIWGRALDWLDSKAEGTGRILEQSAANTLSNIKRSASDLLFDFFTGQLKGLEDAFKRTFHFILRIVTDVFAEIVIQVVLKTAIIKRVIETLSRAIDNIFNKKETPPIMALFESLTSSIVKTTMAVMGLVTALQLVSRFQGGGGGGIFGGGGWPGGGSFGGIGNVFSSAGNIFGRIGGSLPGGFGRFLSSVGVPFAGAGLGFMGGSLLGKLFGMDTQGQNTMGGIGAGGIGIGLALAAMGLGPLGVGIGAILGGAGGGILGSMFGGKDKRTSAQRRTDRVDQFERRALDASRMGDHNQALRWLRDSMQISQASSVIMPALDRAGNKGWFFRLLSFLTKAVNSPLLSSGNINTQAEVDQLFAFQREGQGFNFSRAGNLAAFARSPLDTLTKILSRAVFSRKVTDIESFLSGSLAGQIRPGRVQITPTFGMESGGITTGRRPVFAMLSERPGLREAVIPLNPRTIRMLQREGLGGRGTTINLTMPLTIQALDPEAARRVDWRTITREEILPQVRNALSLSGGKL